jgi:CRISPR-associated endonuclease/helicase Cas3
MHVVTPKRYFEPGWAMSDSREPVVRYTNALVKLGAILFVRLFRAATGYEAFPWQGMLFEEFLRGEFRKACDIPTGLGKTSVIAIWLLALAQKATIGETQDFPRRLVYVVNRRTVVDQSTREAERLRSSFLDRPELESAAAVLRSLAARPSDAPFAISTLRGEFADNAEWRNDPARPAVVVGTVDMIGSRLLFAGYGCGFKTRPLHAGFLGQDSLLVHDEAHLEPAFQKLVQAIESEQQRRNEFRSLRVMELTATSRSPNAAESVLTDSDREHPEVAKRLNARKGLDFVLIANEKEIPEKAVEYALKYRDSGSAILVYLQTVEDLEKVRVRLEKENPVQPLTGTIRGLERDAIVKQNQVFARFSRNPAVAPCSGTVYLLCTSAGEVGVDISADHLICDLTSFDRMAQRFGRVNRFGDGDANIHVILQEPMPEPKSGSGDEGPTEFDRARYLTFSLLRQLPKRADALYDASPHALNSLPESDRHDAFTPAPVILPATDILLDAWAMTTIRNELPGRPPVADWLHGVAEWEPPETHVAWRSEVEIISGDLAERYSPDDLLEDYPLKPHELLHDRTDRVFRQIRELARRYPDKRAWLVSDFDSVKVRTLSELTQGTDRILGNRTVLLPPSLGGLSKSGMLDGTADFDEARTDRYDVADLWLGPNGVQRRCRTWDNEAAPDEMRLVRTIDLRIDPDSEPDGEEQETAMRRYWWWFVRPRSADDEGSFNAIVKQELTPHLLSAFSHASALVEKLGLTQQQATAVRLAARWHDLGKHRKVWQRAIGNSTYPNPVLAKSGGKIRAVELNNYRHEFGSLLDIAVDSSALADLNGLDADTRDLALHLIAAHHGRARPHFPADEAFDPEHRQLSVDEVAHEVPQRFARLQRKYGRWGLAYLESLVRAADAMASEADFGLRSPQE